MKCNENLDHLYIYRHICLMSHQDTHQINPMAPWDALEAPLDPVKPLFPNLLDLPGPLNSPLNLIGPVRSPGLPNKLSEDP